MTEQSKTTKGNFGVPHGKARAELSDKKLSADAEYLLAILVAAGHISENTARQARDLAYEYAKEASPPPPTTEGTPE